MNPEVEEKDIQEILMKEVSEAIMNMERPFACGNFASQPSTSYPLDDNNVWQQLSYPPPPVLRRPTPTPQSKKEKNDIDKLPESMHLLKASSTFDRLNQGAVKIKTLKNFPKYEGKDEENPLRFFIDWNELADYVGWSTTDKIYLFKFCLEKKPREKFDRVFRNRLTLTKNEAVLTRQWSEIYSYFYKIAHQHDRIQRIRHKMFSRRLQEDESVADFIEDLERLNQSLPQPEAIMSIAVIGMEPDLQKEILSQPGIETIEDFVVRIEIARKRVREIRRINERLNAIEEKFERNALSLLSFSEDEEEENERRSSKRRKSKNNKAIRRNKNVENEEDSSRSNYVRNYPPHFYRERNWYRDHPSNSYYPQNYRYRDELPERGYYYGQRFIGYNQRRYFNQYKPNQNSQNWNSYRGRNIHPNDNYNGGNNYQRYNSNYHNPTMPALMPPPN